MKRFIAVSMLLILIVLVPYILDYHFIAIANIVTGILGNGTGWLIICVGFGIMLFELFFFLFKK